MIEQYMEKKFLAIRNNIKHKKPLIHCITNPISINDCANVVLAAGARPIMAEHPQEVEEITGAAKAVAMNLGNITDIRMESMEISAKTAKQKSIPVILDIVGVGCSKLRLDFAEALIRAGDISILKGNMSEIKALCGEQFTALGIDADETDQTNESNLSSNIEVVKSLARKYESVIIGTGMIDIISDGNRTYIVKNGNDRLSMITGTGCMLNVLTASYLAVANKDNICAGADIKDNTCTGADIKDNICAGAEIMEAALLGTAMFGVCGQLASEKYEGTGSFRMKLLDCLSTIKDQTFITVVHMEEA